MPKVQDRPQSVLNIMDYLSRLQIGEEVKYSDITAACKVEVKGKEAWALAQARDILTREIGASFATIRGVGVRRLAASDGLEVVGNNSLKRIRSASKRGQKRITSMLRHANDLTSNEAKKANQRLATFGLIEHLVKSSTVSTMPEAEAPVKPDPLAGLRAMLGKAA